MPAHRGSLAIVLALAVSTATAGTALGKRRSADGPVTLRAETAALAQIELVETSPRRTGATRKPVSDLMLRLRPSDGGALSAVLGLPNAAATGPRRTIMTAEIFVVAAGRILVEEQARCQPWQGDLSWCFTECDGGALALSRKRGAKGASLSLVVGRVPASDDTGANDGARLGACRERPVDAALVSRLGAAPAELPLIPE